nr:unnamed protein product [Spirometra erinaceieuropaei]
MSGKAIDKRSSTDNWIDAILSIAEVSTCTIIPTIPVYSTGTAIDLAGPTSYTIYAIASPTLSTVFRPTVLQAVEATIETIISASRISSPIQGAVAATYITVTAYITNGDIRRTDVVTTTAIILTPTPTPFSATTAIRCRLPACGGGKRFLRRIPP